MVHIKHLLIKFYQMAINFLILFGSYYKLKNSFTIYIQYYIIRCIMMLIRYGNLTSLKIFSIIKICTIKR